MLDYVAAQLLDSTSQQLIVSSLCRARKQTKGLAAWNREHTAAFHRECHLSVLRFCQLNRLSLRRSSVATRLK